MPAEGHGMKPKKPTKLSIDKLKVIISKLEAWEGHHGYLDDYRLIDAARARLVELWRRLEQ